jgi:hypothetical protein
LIFPSHAIMPKTDSVVFPFLRDEIYSPLTTNTLPA